jgi:hypothetical protein
MANETLTMSPQGFQQLKSDEGAIDGLYDDPSHFCTSGVGHLVHRVDKWSSFFIAAARDDARWKKLLAQSGATKYLPRATAFDSRFLISRLPRESSRKMPWRIGTTRWITRS